MPATTSLSEFPDFVRNWSPQSAARHGLDYARFETDPASRYSSLMPWQLADTAAVFARVFPDPASVRVVIDGTAHIGVDALHFAHMFAGARVFAVEKAPAVCEKLKRNIAAAAADPARLRPICDSFLAVARRAAAGEYGAVDLVYLDPPWGGLGYRDTAKLELALDSVDIGKIAADALKFARVVAVKAPVNFASWSLEHAAAAAGASVEVFEIHHSESRRLQYRLYVLRRAP